mmetsp:Transcript_26061/g.30065  ORF Transcript_26061/g.30065 Transcript_26061/m.30065 type:complete len:151 (-) Transcript_26061:1283-1735(-)
MIKREFEIKGLPKEEYSESNSFKSNQELIIFSSLKTEKCEKKEHSDQEDCSVKKEFLDSCSDSSDSIQTIESAEPDVITSQLIMERAVSRESFEDEYTAICALNPSVSSWIIQAKVVTKSPVKNYTVSGQPGSMFSFELADARGGQISAI